MDEKDKPKNCAKILKLIGLKHKVMIYCNTKEFVDNMVNNSYHMNVAAKGSVNDKHHKDLIETQLWMNPTNNQWAIVFVYKELDRSCVIGGNHIKLYSPKEE